MRIVERKEKCCFVLFFRSTLFHYRTFVNSKHYIKKKRKIIHNLTIQREPQ